MFTKILKGMEVMSFFDLSEELIEDQKKFRNFIRYLHNNALSSKIYESLGIKGFDGQGLTDKGLFRETYLDYHIKQSIDTHMNSVFANMYHGLEILGIVKGRPRKQRMMNMINDGKHSYFGAFCDIVVSSDDDFLNKTKFLYDVFDIKTSVLSTEEFRHHLKFPILKNTISDCIESIRGLDFAKMLKVTNEEGEYLIAVLSPKVYGYFNRLVFAPREQFDNFYFLRERENWSSGTLAKEIEYITNSLITELGPDFNEKEVFNGKEFMGEEWDGRIWVMPEVLIELGYKNSLSLRFGFLNDYES
ncbi:hypothetical protein JMN32_06805 [Fulvivirga sp. 29W222]|uniref:Uncharacterized protein n=1 Tax=Fulvivirga marina TaxID=2494733 RepID=A0A937KAU5_9BACT|nr:hypothetical protein [Fulvivirga marina]MBL6446011.1 hypothetical protein [Fulvivirga marina]